MAVVGVGIVIGIVAMSKIINFFLTRYYTGTFAIIIGLVIGSIVVVFPGWPTGTSVMLLSVGTFAAGLLTAYILGKVRSEEHTSELQSRGHLVCRLLLEKK